MEQGLTYKLIETEDELDALCLELSAASIIAVDTETEGLNYNDIIVGIALACDPDVGYYIPIRHEAVDGIKYDNQLDPKLVFSKLKPILEKVPCTGHNDKFDIKMFWKDDIDVNYVHDTLILAHVLGISANGSRGLKQLTGSLLGHQMGDLNSLFVKVGNKKAEIRPKILAPEDIREYGCEDGIWSLRLFHYLIRMLEKQPKLHLIYKIEMNLLRVVAEMEAFGVPVSMEFLQLNSKKADEYIAHFETVVMEEIREQLNDPEYEVNMKSPKQLGTLLFDHLQLPVIKHSAKTGNPSTDASVLHELAKLSPVVQSILTLRGMEKLNNTYLYGLQTKVHNDGRIRGSFNQSGTASGRFSSSDPNLQNLPKDQTFTLWQVPADKQYNVADHFMEMDPPLLREAERNADATWDWESFNVENGIWEDSYIGELDGIGYGVKNGKLYEMWRCKTRDFIEAPPGYYLIEADYSQIELRIMAGESQEPTLLDAYFSGADVHRRTAAVVQGIAPENVTDAQRHVGKTMNFSLLYGAGPYNISQQLKIPIEEAQDIVNKYFTNLSKVKSWINRVKQDTKMDGYAETIFGRKRVFPNVRGGDHKLAEKELRESVNHHIQGAAADIMKLALVRASRKLREHFGNDVKVISTVHDSLLLECKDTHSVEDVLLVLRGTMEDITIDAQLSKDLKSGAISRVPVKSDWPLLEIDAKVGRAWGSAVKYKMPTDRPLPPLVPSDQLEKIRVRKVAHERENVSHSDDIMWNISISKVLSPDDFVWLRDYLSRHKSTTSMARVKLIFGAAGGEVVEDVLEGTYDIEFSHQTDFCMKLGPTIITQDIEALDYGEVLKGVNFGI